MNCIHCSKEIAGAGSLKAHEMSCKLNPGRVQHRRSPNAGKQKGSTAWNKGVETGPNPNNRNWLANEDVFVSNSTTARIVVRKKVLQYKLIEYVCACCGIGPEWQKQPMPLILDHINGINNDNRLENLRFVCSNCDSQLPTYKARNKKPK
jgi:hypothetical protein